jgi:hypothetical protein
MSRENRFWEIDIALEVDFHWSCERIYVDFSRNFIKNCKPKK